MKYKNCEKNKEEIIEETKEEGQDVKIPFLELWKGHTGNVIAGMGSRYVEGVGCEGDVLLAISTSGNSSNIVKAAESAHLKKMKVLALTSTGDNRLSALSDIVIAAPKVDFSDRVQEIHIQVIHILIQAIEKQLGFE